MTNDTVIATCTAGPGQAWRILEELGADAVGLAAHPVDTTTLDGPGCNPMTTHASARTRIITLIAAALLAVGGCASNPGTAPTTAPATPADVAAAFAAAYSSGDTPTACSYASGRALDQLNKNGWCQAKQQWNVQYTQTGTCTLPTGETSFNYDTSSEINRHRGFDMLITGAGEVYKVTTLVAKSGDTFCRINATTGTPG